MVGMEGNRDQTLEGPVGYCRTLGFVLSEMGTIIIFWAEEGCSLGSALKDHGELIVEGQRQKKGIMFRGYGDNELRGNYLFQLKNNALSEDHKIAFYDYFS